MSYMSPRTLLKSLLRLRKSLCDLLLLLASSFLFGLKHLTSSSHPPDNNGKKKRSKESEQLAQHSKSRERENDVEKIYTFWGEKRRKGPIERHPTSSSLIVLLMLADGVLLFFSWRFAPLNPVLSLIPFSLMLSCRLFSSESSSSFGTLSHRHPPPPPPHPSWMIHRHP